MPDIFVAPVKKDDLKINDSYKEEVKKIGDDTYSDGDLDDKNNSIHLFSSFCKNPGGVTFQNQDEGEKVLLFIRSANVTNIKWVSIGILLILIPLFFLLTSGVIGSPFSLLPMRFNLIFLAFYYLIVFAYFYVNFITWYFNISLITNKRVMDVDYTGLVYKDVATTKINLIQDVSYTQIGVARNFFDYGEILVQTAGTLENFRFESAPQPEKIVHVIENLIGKRYAKP